MGAIGNIIGDRAVGVVINERRKIMDYIFLAVIVIIGGALAGWASGSNIDKHPMDIPMIFHTINPLYFMGAGLLTPAVVGYLSFGFVGLIAGLVGAWITSVVVGSTIEQRSRRT